MPQIQRIGNGQGDLEIWDIGTPAGVAKTVRIAAPVNGQPGFAPGCEYIQYFGTNYAIRYVNAGSNASSLWVEADGGPASGTVFGNSGVPIPSGAAVMLASGNIARNFLNAAGISPTATGNDYIVAAYTLPANSLEVAGRILQVTVYGTAAATANNKEFKVFLGATNTGITNGANVAGQSDGTVAVTGGTVIGDTGALATNNGGILLQCQLSCRDASHQDSMTTSIIGGSTHGGVGKWTDQTFTTTGALLLVATARATTLATDTVFNGWEVTAFNALLAPALLVASLSLPPEFAGLCHLLAGLSAVGLALALLGRLRHSLPRFFAHRKGRAGPVPRRNCFSFVRRAWASLLPLLGLRDGGADAGLVGGVCPALPVVVGELPARLLGEIPGVARTTAREAVDVEPEGGVCGSLLPDPVPLAFRQAGGIEDGLEDGELEGVGAVLVPGGLEPRVEVGAGDQFNTVPAKPVFRSPGGADVDPAVDLVLDLVDR